MIQKLKKNHIQNLLALQAGWSAPRRGGAPLLWPDEAAEAEAAEAAALELQLLTVAALWKHASMFC